MQQKLEDAHVELIEGLEATEELRKENEELKKLNEELRKKNGRLATFLEERIKASIAMDLRLKKLEDVVPSTFAQFDKLNQDCAILARELKASRYDVSKTCLQRFLE